MIRSQVRLSLYCQTSFLKDPLTNQIHALKRYTAPNALIPLLKRLG